MSAAFTESIVEDAALAWLEGLGYAVLHGPDIAAGEPKAERTDPGGRDVVLERRLRQALARLNPGLPPEALDDAYRRLTRVDAPSLLERNRAVQRMLVWITGAGMARSRELSSRSSTSTRRPATTGWPSTSSPSPRGGTRAGPTWWCSSTGCRWR
jgi:hypothetical protein